MMGHFTQRHFGIVCRSSTQPTRQPFTQPSRPRIERAQLDMLDLLHLPKKGIARHQQSLMDWFHMVSLYIEVVMMIVDYMDIYGLYMDYIPIHIVHYHPLSSSPLQYTGEPVALPASLPHLHACRMRRFAQALDTPSHACEEYWAKGATAIGAAGWWFQSHLRNRPKIAQVRSTMQYPLVI